jgi:hypothetical protein
VAGRHSRRYYRHATRWMVNDVAFHRERTRGASGTRRVARLGKTWLNARIGRMGMRLTAREVEQGVGSPR